MEQKTPKLSRRLLCAAQLVRQGAKAADVGCDHGKLSAWLICTEQAGSVVATDINPMPLQKARDLFEKLGITDRAKTVLCAGLDGVAPKEADDIVIAGIGSEVTNGVIEAAAWLKDPNKRLILLPSSHHERVRIFLYREGFELLSETAVYEAGHCYSVMHAQYCGNSCEISPAFASLGLIRQTDDDAKKYIQKEKEKAQRIADNTDDPEKAARAENVLRYIQEELQW